MSDLLNSTLGVVGQVGDAFDKVTGGRALRGALAGKPRELLSPIPFSDSMGLTDAKDKTSGRDLTDAYGLTNRGDNSFGSHAAGFLADTVLSPGNLAGGYGAFKAAPTLAKGITSGAKALTGLDLLDGVGSTLGRFAKSDAGSLDLSGIAKSTASANDSLLKYMPWAGKSDVSGPTEAALQGSGRQSGILEALANRPQNVGEMPFEAATNIGKANKVPTMLFEPDDVKKFSGAYNMSQEEANRAMAWYLGRQNVVALNGNQPQWKNSELMSQFMADRGPSGRGWFSSSDPNHIINHELAHASHRNGVGVDRFMNDPLLQGELPDDEHTFLAHQISKYATTNPKEAIAELVAALNAKRDLHPNSKPELATILQNYGGKNLWQNLGDNGLLKGLGLTGLGMLGVGAASQQGAN